MILSTYKHKLITDIKQGATLHCTEGLDYKVWLTYPDKTKRTIRVDSAVSICTLFRDKLIFGNEGITWNNKYKTL